MRGRGTSSLGSGNTPLLNLIGNEQDATQSPHQLFLMAVDRLWHVAVPRMFLRAHIDSR